MDSFKDLCKIAEELSPDDYTTVLTVKTAKIMPALETLTGSIILARQIYGSFIFGAIYADGKLDEAEFTLIEPLLKIVFGDDITFKDAKAMVRSTKAEGKELKDNVDAMVDLFGELDDELKDDIVIVSLLICAIDGKVSKKEQQYIQQLIA